MRRCRSPRHAIAAPTRDARMPSALQQAPMQRSRLPPASLARLGAVALPLPPPSVRACTLCSARHCRAMPSAQGQELRDKALPELPHPRALHAHLAAAALPRCRSRCQQPPRCRARVCPPRRSPVHLALAPPLQSVLPGERRYKKGPLPRASCPTAACLLYAPIAKHFPVRQSRTFLAGASPRRLRTGEIRLPVAPSLRLEIVHILLPRGCAIHP
jgi:hypothetical protein